MNTASQTQPQQQKPAQETPKAWGTTNLRCFIGAAQMRAITMAERGEEGAHFTGLLEALTERVNTMPRVYQQDGADDPIAFLHYFKGNADFYITERDLSHAQHQAFGLANLGYGGELGYISISELIANGVELDLYFTPAPLSTCKRR